MSNRENWPKNAEQGRSQAELLQRRLVYLRNAGETFFQVTSRYGIQGDKDRSAIVIRSQRKNWPKNAEPRGAALDVIRNLPGPKRNAEKQGTLLRTDRRSSSLDDPGEPNFEKRGQKCRN